MKYLVLIFCFISILNADINDRIVKMAISSENNMPQFVESSGKLFFANSTSSNNEQIWVTDGTVEGTKNLEEFSNFPTGERTNIIIDDLSKLIVSNNKGMWATDGTDAGTQKFTGHAIRGVGTYFMQNKGRNAIINNSIVIEAFREVFKKDIFITDGTAKGTKTIFDNEKLINLNKTGKLKNNFILTIESELDSKYYYYSVDATTLDTVNFLVNDAEINMSAEYNEKIYFLQPHTDTTCSLWSSRGTIGTNELVAIIPTNEAIQDSYFKIYNNNLYFTVIDAGNVTTLWQTNGTDAGTKKVSEIFNTSVNYKPKFIEFKNKLLITNDNIESIIWITDGTTNGTFELINRGHNDESLIKSYSIIRNKLFTIKTDSEGRSFPVISDGTKEGTKEVKIQNMESEMASIPFLEDYVGNHAIFQFRDNEDMINLVVSDGTDEGTTVFNRYNSNTFYIINSATIFEDYVIFTDNSDKNKFKTYNLVTGERKELKPANATVNEFRNSTLGSHIYKGDFYFFAEYYQDEVNLWKIEGTQTSIEETPQPELMTVYPNPAKDFIQLELTKPMQLSVINSTGALVKEYGIVENGKLNVAELSSGVYFVVDEQGNNIAKFVKE
ncbi:MAG: T9SS type A sorting domain-containing protein [Candidatus Kapaibacterium sp.]